MENNNFSVQPTEQVPAVTPSKDDCNMGMLAHLLALLTGFIGPLIIYLMKKDESPFVRENARNALNFQISVFIYYIIGAILTIVLVGILVLIAVGILHLVCCIVGAVAASNGKIYKYPLTIQFLK